ncbi:hypothetical protein EI42_05981 [Thermosporothrix hazakensis]|jgi:predicted Holliday junction resolvase-like endonuclease|uniref:LemA protein n=1 Tax=Thermosporothrix hazakensis TaxID=644383 RepID=A0A326TT24_THEHA|nr:hypothetical protein [Thermosporothrix hazakensis]PZW19672.1 hypothetical protein EI42_05981 [Thermosporothrix hazakensis]GCE49215.1 hypothetical protein KTH_40840 [Thermosporothrix hazakensis]
MQTIIFLVIFVVLIINLFLLFLERARLQARLRQERECLFRWQQQAHNQNRILQTFFPEAAEKIEQLPYIPDSVERERRIFEIITATILHDSREDLK